MINAEDATEYPRYKMPSDGKGYPLKPQRIPSLFLLVALLSCSRWTKSEPLTRKQEPPDQTDQGTCRLTYGRLKESEFFSHFHLTEELREALPSGETRVHIELTGLFRKVVEMTLDVDRRQQVTSASLILDRKFVGNTHHVSPFAKDIANSFILAMVSDADSRQANYLVDGIWDLSGDRDRIFRRQSENPRTPVPPDVRHALAVFMGIEQRAEVSMTAVNVLLENMDVPSAKLRLYLRLSECIPTLSHLTASTRAIPNDGGDCFKTAGISWFFARIRSVCVINKQMASARDLESKAAVIVSPEKVLMTADFNIGFGHGHEGTQLLVYDGRNGHSIILRHHILESDTYVYEDIWNEGSFLQLANNRAGVAATLWNLEEPKRLWVVKRSELLRVAYAAVVYESSLTKWEKFMELLSGDKEVALQHFRGLHQKTPGGYETAEQRMVLLGRALLLGGHAALARVLADIRVNLYPDSAQAAADLADVMVEQGDRENAGVQYKQALKLAAHDTTLPEDKNGAFRNRVKTAIQGLRLSEQLERSVAQ